MNKEGDERYRLGFNHGYVLTEAGIKLPKVEERSGPGAKEYAAGLKDGSKEYEKRIARTKGNDLLRDGIRNAPAVRPPNRSKGR